MRQKKLTKLTTVAVSANENPHHITRRIVFVLNDDRKDILGIQMEDNPTVVFENELNIHTGLGKHLYRAFARHLKELKEE